MHRGFWNAISFCVTTVVQSTIEWLLGLLLVCLLGSQLSSSLTFCQCLRHTFCFEFETELTPLQEVSW
jgi:hypothetical protein